MIQLQHIQVVLNEKAILRSINLNWKKGESIALTGANGAGKSTLLKVLSGSLQPNEGEIVHPEKMNPQQWRRNLGVIFEGNFLYEAMTAVENLHFYARLFRIAEPERAEKMLEKVGLFSVRHEQVRTFSKGMKQRLSIARALIHQPEYMLLDEPFDGLDSDSAHQIQHLLLDLKKDGIGWILVSHDIQKAWTLCDRAILLNQGCISLDMSCNDHTLPVFLNEHYRFVKESPYALY